ncbi:MAG: glutamyl-tRNA reductase [Candidatus Dormibacteria bacterium]
MRLLAAGISFRTAPVAVRERAALSEPAARHLLRFLIGHGSLTGAAAISTCNRTELYVSAPEGADPEVIVPRLRRYLDPSGEDADPGHVTVFRDEAAVEHLFRVATGLDSMVVGETQVLGQVKAAHRLALETGSLDAQLDFVFRRAIAAAKLARTQTGIGRAAGSISEAAISVAERVLGSLDGRTALVIGAGNMSALAARRLQREGARLRVSSRGGESAAALAHRLGAAVFGAEEMTASMVACDLVVTATSSTEPVLDRALCAAVQEQRGGRPLCLIDLAVPRDVAPDVAGLPGVTLIDIDELGRRLGGGVHDHRQSVDAAAALVADEVQRTMAVLSQRNASTPTIRALLERAESIRRGEVERTLARLPAGEGDVAERIDKLSRSLVRKLLHAPIAHLRAAGEDPGAVLRLREAFDLDDLGPGER